VRTAAAARAGGALRGAFPVAANRSASAAAVETPMTALKFVAAVAFLLAAVGGTLFATGAWQGLVQRAFVAWYAPDAGFDPADAAPAPDYADAGNWAALPSLQHPARLRPAGVADGVEQGSAPADVFFVHPTGYLSGASWTSPMAPDSATEENTRWMLANQASAFNGCCNVYAPRYREASIFAYVGRSAAERDRVLAFAYQDVLAAFRHFLAHHNAGRPFVLASHSQGSHHASRLLAEEIDGTALHDRLVAAYTIGAVGNGFSAQWFATLRDVKPCAGPVDTGCVVHWDTVAEGGNAIGGAAPSLCTNPLTWRVDESLAPASLHRGAVPPAGIYAVGFGRDDAARGTAFKALAAPIPGHTWAQCRGGTLFVADQAGTAMAGTAMGAAGSRNYHGLDYPLFHMDIRENAKARVQAWLAARAQAGSAPAATAPGGATPADTAPVAADVPDPRPADAADGG
jgi:hypothetical protein